MRDNITNAFNHISSLYDYIILLFIAACLGYQMFILIRLIIKKNKDLVRGNLIKLFLMIIVSCVILYARYTRY